MTDTTEQKQKPHLYKKGQSGNPLGRPKGSKNKLSEEFIRALAEDFASGGIQAIQTVREDHPETYVRVIASLVPKEFIGNVDHTHEHTHVAVSEVDRIFAEFSAGTKTRSNKKTLPN